MKNFEKAIDRVIAKLFECTEELKQCNEEIEKLQTEILDKEEKEYLSAVITPFRDQVEYIKKYSIFDKYEWIRISLKGGDFSFPNFNKGTMYKGMEPDKEYTLEELGL